jgi:N4-gp56 family major capsid protein
MAQTNYTVNSAETNKIWAIKTFQEALKSTIAYKFIGGTSDAGIQRRDELKKSSGDRIRVTLRMQLTGRGVQGDGVLEGNEENLTTYTDDLLINQLRHAVNAGGVMSNQRVPFSTREEAMMGLRDWWKDRIDAAAINHLVGNTIQSDTAYTGNNAAIAVSSTRIVRPLTYTNDSSLTTASTDSFTLSLIDRAVATAKTATPMVRPLKVGGQEMYACILHPYQVQNLRASVSGTQWVDIQKQRLAGGVDENNPLMTGLLGIYNNTMLYEDARIPAAIDNSGAAVANTRRAAFFGAQALCIGFGRDTNSETELSWNEKAFDYDNVLGVKAGMVFGVKKMVFNSVDFGTIPISTYAAIA